MTATGTGQRAKSAPRARVPHRTAHDLPEATTSELAERLVELRRELRRAVRATIANDGPHLLPVAQVEVLQAVFELNTAAGPPRVRQVAAALSLADNTISGLVAELVRRGLLARTVDPTDERAVHLTVTRTGSDQLRAWAHAHSHVLTAGLAALDGETDVEAATAAVNQLVAILRASRGTTSARHDPVRTAPI